MDPFDQLLDDFNEEREMASRSISPHPNLNNPIDPHHQSSTNHHEVIEFSNDSASTFPIFYSHSKETGQPSPVSQTYMDISMSSTSNNSLPTPKQSPSSLILSVNPTINYKFHSLDQPQAPAFAASSQYYVQTPSPEPSSSLNCDVYRSLIEDEATKAIDEFFVDASRRSSMIINPPPPSSSYPSRSSLVFVESAEILNRRPNVINNTLQSSSLSSRSSSLGFAESAEINRRPSAINDFPLSSSRSSRSSSLGFAQSAKNFTGEIFTPLPSPSSLSLSLCDFTSNDGDSLVFERPGEMFNPLPSLSASLRLSDFRSSDGDGLLDSPTIGSSSGLKVFGDRDQKSKMDYFCKVIGEYLEDPVECTIVISHPTSVLKSYQSVARPERRFFGPPPVVLLAGKGWGELYTIDQQRDATFFNATFSLSIDRKYHDHHTSTKSNNRKRIPQHSGESDSSDDDSTSTEFNIDVIYIDQMRMDGISETSSIRDLMSMDVNGLSTDYRDVVCCMFKKMFVSEMSSFSFGFKGVGENGDTIFKFQSKPVEVLSKAPTLVSKIRKHVLISGTTVTFSGRSKSQHSRTKYLRTSQDGQSLTTTFSNQPTAGNGTDFSDAWESFVIWKLDDPNFNKWKLHKQSMLPLSYAHYLSDSSTNNEAWARNEIKDLCLELKSNHSPNSLDDPFDLVMTRPVLRAVDQSGSDEVEEIISLNTVFDEVGLATVKEDEEGGKNFVGARGEGKKRKKFIENVYYGNRIVLQSVNTGLVTNPFIIREVLRGNLVKIGDDDDIGSDCPVYSLQKIALEIADNTTNYVQFDMESRETDTVSVSEGELTVVKETLGKGRVKENVFCKVSENHTWAIVETARTDITFHIPPTLTLAHPPTSPKKARSNNSTSRPSIQETLNLPNFLFVNPIPLVCSIQVHSSNKIVYLEGMEFSSRFFVFFGSFPAEKVVAKSSVLLEVHLPKFAYREEQENMDVPVLLIRDDGVVYKTGKYITV